MRKLLLGTAAVALAASFASSPANAQVKLDVGGHFKGYVTWHDQDEDDGPGVEGDAEARSFDILRDTELHFTGETTLDNGLTVGFHTELEADPDDTTEVQESYAYFSGAWGRVNFGAEDGAAYLLQVAAPSADSNVDGLRQYVNAVNYAVAPDGDGRNGPNDTFNYANLAGSQFDYAQDVTGYYDKLTYMTPVFNGFQAAASYTPDVLGFGANVSRDNPFGVGVTTDDFENAYGAAWEASARYEGQFDQIGLTLGGGFTDVDMEQETTVPAVVDDRQVWNGGANVNWSAFNLGVSYKDDDNGLEGDFDTTTWVIGGDYTTGPFKLGVSYMDREDEQGAGVSELETNRYSGGVVYTYGPGMTFRGSLHYVEHDAGNGADEFDATTLLLGTQINF